MPYWDAPTTAHNGERYELISYDGAGADGINLEPSQWVSGRFQQALPIDVMYLAADLRCGLCALCKNHTSCVVGLKCSLILAPQGHKSIPGGEFEGRLGYGVMATSLSAIRIKRRARCKYYAGLCSDLLFYTTLKNIGPMPLEVRSLTL